MGMGEGGGQAAGGREKLASVIRRTVRLYHRGEGGLRDDGEYESFFVQTRGTERAERGPCRSIQWNEAVAERATLNLGLQASSTYTLDGNHMSNLTAREGRTIADEIASRIRSGSHTAAAWMTVFSLSRFHAARWSTVL